MISKGKIVAIVASVLGLGGATGYAVWRMAGDPDRPTREDVPPDVMPPPPGQTQWKGVNAILSALQNAAAMAGIPLGLLVGWVGKESAGRLSSKTSLDERGYFQLMPSESKSIGVDHERLSTDSQYSIDAGIKLVKQYAERARALGVAPEGSSYFWKLVKLGHSMGSGQTKKVVDLAKKEGKAGSWEALRDFALGLKINGPQPKKWFPFVDTIYAVGRSFGFGAEVGPSLVGELRSIYARPAEWAMDNQQFRHWQDVHRAVQEQGETSDRGIDLLGVEII